VPLLGMVKPTGRVAIPKLAVSLDPMAARGQIALEDVVVNPPDRAPVSLRGAIDLLGTEARTRELVARAAEQPIRVDATVAQLFESPRFDVSFETKGADTNALLTGYVKQPDRLIGPLDFKGALRGTAGGETPLLDALSGNLALDIEAGRIVGVSLLEAALGSFGSRIAEAVRQQGGKDWERFTSDRFESLRATLQIAGGRLLTQPITLTYPDWGAQLDGPIRLADLALDLKGRLTIAESLDRALARAFGARDDYVPQKRVVELASVRGELGAPKVQISGSAVATLAAAYAGALEREELKKRIEKELGPGSGEIVDQGLDVLQGIFGGKKSEKK
jgi:AsmA-like C-terminal region